MITFPYHATRLFSLPRLSHSFIYPKKSTHMHDYKWNLHYTLYVYMEQIFISTALFLLNWWLFYLYQSIFFFNMNMLRTQIFNFIPCNRTITQIYLIIWFKLFYYGFFYERLIYILKLVFVIKSPLYVAKNITITKCNIFTTRKWQMITNVECL